MGKSAVIADVIDRLRDDGTLHLAFRVHQPGAIATLDELGPQTVGTADNPVVILEQLAAGKRAVLIVDKPTRSAKCRAGPPRCGASCSPSPARQSSIPASRCFFSAPAST